MSVVLTAWNMGVIVGPAVGGMSNITQFNAVIYQGLNTFTLKCIMCNSNIVVSTQTSVRGSAVACVTVPKN